MLQTLNLKVSVCGLTPLTQADATFNKAELAGPQCFPVPW